MQECYLDLTNLEDELNDERILNSNSLAIYFL